MFRGGKMYVENTCFRCGKTVYPTDKIGPLKDFTFFHSGCFRCVVCNSKLTLRTYYNNQHSQEDKEVYCGQHVPKIGPGHFDSESIGIKAAIKAPKSAAIVNEQIRPGGKATFDADALAIRSQMTPARTSTSEMPANGADEEDGVGGGGGGGIQSNHPNAHNWGRYDSSALHIQHALRATEVQRKYSKPHEKPLEEFLDREEQVRLEEQHRAEEDRLYRQFLEQRDREKEKVNHGLQEEWEVELEKLTAKFERELGKRKTSEDVKVLTIKHNKEKEEAKKNLTIKREKKTESIQRKLLEQERAATAALVEKHSKEMMTLIQEKRAQYDHDEADGEGSAPLHQIAAPSSKGPERAPSVGASVSKEEGGVGSSTHSANGGDKYPSQPPPPVPPSFAKTEIYRDPTVFAGVDERAISVAQEDQQTFTDLVRQLVAGCSSDVEKARAIFRWITVKNLNSIMFEDAERGDTPMGLLRGIKFGTESYHVLFKRLCSYAGLHCVVIKGYSKSAGYQPGVKFEDNRFRNSWNAVYVAGAWRFVQCNWGARHLVNAKEVPKPGRAKSDSLRYEYDDHYFLTDPKEFIYEFFPLQSEWQLLRNPITLEEFEELPFVRSLFFRYQLSFPSDNMKSVMNTDSTGAATIRLEMPSHMQNSLIFHYNLKFYGDDTDNYDGISLKRFVMQSVVGNVVAFRVHAPCSGNLLLDIFANAVTPQEYLTGEPMKFKSVCKFKILCAELQTVMVPLPDCASGEWGPAKATRLFGLVPVSHEEALVFSGRELDITFRMTRPLTDFMATLHKNGLEEKRLSKYVSHSFAPDDKNLITLHVTFPEEGQYGMDIYTREVQAANGKASNGSNGGAYTNGDSPSGSSRSSSEKHLLTHCCKYLINSTRKK